MLWLHILWQSFVLLLLHFLGYELLLFSSLNFGGVTDRQRAMHMSPPCISTGVLKTMGWWVGSILLCPFPWFNRVSAIPYKLVWREGQENENMGGDA